MAPTARNRGSGSGVLARLCGVALVAALLAFVVSNVSRGTHKAASFRAAAGDVQQSASGDVRLSTAGTLFEIIGRPEEGTKPGELRAVRDAKGTAFDGVAIGAMVDGAAAELSVENPRTTRQGPAHAVAHALLRASNELWEAEVEYRMVRAPPALFISLRLLSPQPHRIALTLATPVGRTIPFVRGAGVLADSGEAKGAWVVFARRERASVVGALHGDVDLHIASPEDVDGAPPVATIIGPETLGREVEPMFISAAASSAAAAEAAARLRHESVRRLSGRVVGSGAEVDVWEAGPDGRPLLHVWPDARGRFEVVAPVGEVGFYATMAHMRASPIVVRPPNDDSEIELTMLPGGEVHAQVVDYDTGQPLTARLIVHGIAPTADPNFGPDYRGSGAGPIIDALKGEAMMPLPTGRYRVLCTKGPEYTIDERPVDVAPGSSHALRFTLRHVVDTPSWVACDLHVHARPSFDSPVLPEDRVVSLVSAGIDFAVSTEHNTVGHYYGPAIEALGLEGDLASVPGVEVTTAFPRLGHFNVFPYDAREAPPCRKTTQREIFTRARALAPSCLVQVDHPRLRGLGYFDVVGLDSKSGHAEKEKEWRTDFDLIEVYNGFEARRRDRVEVVLQDWLHLLALGHRYTATGGSDSHRIQYQWAGYPRTYVKLAPEEAGETGAPLDSAALILALKSGRALVTSGPFIDASIDGQGPGSTVVAGERLARLHLRVRAAPWIDVTEAEVFLGAMTHSRIPIAARATVTGPPTGELAPARGDAVRLERDIDIALPAAFEHLFVVVVVRGTRTMDDVLPYMPIQPFAVTNPIWIEHR